MSSSVEFQEFYEASYSRTVAMLAAILGSRAEAEGIAQEAHARALAQVDPSISPFAW